MKDMTLYKAYTIIDGKPRWIITDENGNIINSNPNNKELRSAHIQNSRKKRFSDKELLNFLQAFYKENGKVPIVKDFFNNSKYPSCAIYQKRFGSWNNAMKLAGLDSREKYARGNMYTDKELLNFLNIYYEENEKVPTRRDFLNNLAYPDYQNYVAHFGSWNNALKLVGLDLDTMVMRGVLETDHQKGRWVEIIVRDHFEKDSVDLSGNNRNNIIDGICPNGQTYDVKKCQIVGTWQVERLGLWYHE